MADDNSSEFQELNSNLRELISLLKNPSASRLRAPSSTASENKAQKIFKQAGGIVSDIVDLEKQIVRNKGSVDGLNKIKDTINKYKKALGEIDSALKSIKSAGVSSRYVSSAEDRLAKGRNALTSYGRRIGGYVAQASQNQVLEMQRQEQQRALEISSRERLNDLRYAQGQFSSAEGWRQKRAQELSRARGIDLSLAQKQFSSVEGWREGRLRDAQKSRMADLSFAQKQFSAGDAFIGSLRNPYTDLANSNFNAADKYREFLSNPYVDLTNKNFTSLEKSAEASDKERRKLEILHTNALKENSRFDERASIKTLREEAKSAQSQEKQERYQRAYEAQEGMWVSRGSYIKNKFPFIGSNATNLKKLQIEHGELTELFRSEKDLGIRQTYIQRGRENELNQERALYNLGRGSLFNIGGKPVGTDPGEIFGAAKGASLAKLASSGPIGQVAAGIIQVGTAIAKTVNLVSKVPQMIAGFTGSLVSEASPASNVYRQSQLLSLISGGQSTSDFRRWWHPERSSVYSSMLHTRHPMAIGPAEMTKLLGGMSLSGAVDGSGMSGRGMFAKQLNDAIFYSSRFGGSMNLASLIKTMATGTPGYNFHTTQAQLPSSFAGILGMARGRHQDINDVYRSMDRAVATAQGSQNTTVGSFGGGFGGLASAVSGYGASAQYNPASTMASLVGGAQSLHSGAFGNSAYTVGQMMFLQSHGGLRGLMNKGIYKDLLQDYGKAHPDMLKFGLASPGGAAIFMRAALSGHARNYNYAVSSLGMTGLPPAIQSLMLGNATGLGVSAADFIRRTISKNPQTTVSATTLATAHGHGIAPGSDLATAMTAPIGQEMIQFTASMTALVKSGVITKFGHEIGSLNMVVHNLTQGMGRLFHIIDHLKAS